MPTYNGSKYISEAIESIINQTFTDWELIIVDDCSTDDTPNIIQKYVVQDSRIRMLTMPSNSGSARLPRRLGVYNANGEYICLIDHDDYIAVDYFEKIVTRIHETHSDVILSQFIVKKEHSPNLCIPSSNFDFAQLLSGYNACLQTIPHWKLGCNGCCVTTSLYKNIVDESNNTFMNGDEIDSRKILLNAQQVAFAETQYYHIKHGNNLSDRIAPKFFEKTLTNNQLYLFTKENEIGGGTL